MCGKNLQRVKYFFNKIVLFFESKRTLFKNNKNLILSTVAVAQRLAERALEQQFLGWSTGETDLETFTNLYFS